MQTKNSGIDVNTGKPASTSAGKLFGLNTIHGVDGPYMTRIWIGRLRLHIFHRGDLDPDCHDHPFDFWTFPLTPYVEEVAHQVRDTLVEGQDEPKRRFFKTCQVVPAWRLSFRPAEHCHRVLGRWIGDGRGHHNAYPGIRPGKIITIVWVSKRKRDWGFLKNRDGAWCWVTWRDYVFGGGKRGPCE